MKKKLKKFEVNIRFGSSRTTVRVTDIKSTL
jgi:hypothetical protein